MPNSSPLGDVPILETQRLRLRGHRAADLADCFAMWSDPAITRYIGGKPSTEQQAWSRMLTFAGHWSLMGFGYWAIEERESGLYVGDLGFADFHRSIAATMKGVPELGWALAAAFHARGYATEAARAAVAWGDERFESPRTVCMIDTQNTASIRVAEKCGYREFERTAFNESPTIFFERFAPWELPGGSGKTGSPQPAKGV
jgi:RimJ/RimL family protein N-acetyltransferase